MLSKIKSATLCGIEGQIITIETDISDGLPSFYMVGLADQAVREARERVGSALKNSGFVFPRGRVTVNLAPADIKKEGTYLDLPIAIGLLFSSTQIVYTENIDEYIVLGELSLDGKLQLCKGILPMICSAKEYGYKKFIVPKDNADEAALARNCEIYAVETLYDVVKHLSTSKKIPAHPLSLNHDSAKSEYDIDFSDVKGQESVKRAMEIAAAGGHNMMMIGPPGSGKTMLAKRFATILPDMSIEESLEVTKLHSVAGLIDPQRPLICERPFRSPHHTISPVALVGGGRVPKPGEVSLAHCGVLFLDEFAEFPKYAIEVLRQPLEDRKVSISRVNASQIYPASFMLLASMNPCPCGYLNDPTHECKCSQASIERYMQRISGPILDRIDIVCQVNVEDYEKLKLSSASGETSAEIRNRIAKARQIQNERFAACGARFNANLMPVQLESFCALGKDEEELMRTAFRRYNLSARSYHRIIKLSRTIADLGGSKAIRIEHISEALQYRGLDKKYCM